MRYREPAVAVLSVATALSMTACSTSFSVGSDSDEVAPPPVSGGWQCEDVPESPDGKYDLGDAGEVSISPEGQSLSPVGAAAGEKYGRAEARLYDRAAEVEIRHRTDGSRVLFRADLRSDRREVQVCRDPG